jgi:glycosyltransferase involved in cell wall biosynthesis
MISVVILTLNEATNLPRCLASISWCDDILVVDSGSTDNTVALAQATGARILQRPFDNFANQRNFALDHGQLRHEWVLHLDADEEASNELLTAMRAVVESPEHKTAYRVAGQIIFMDRWLKHAGMYPCYQVRFGDRDRLRFKQVGHGQREALPAAELGTLDADLIHHNFSKGVADWFTRHAHYARDEAQSRFVDRKPIHLGAFFRSREPLERWRETKRLAARMPFRPLLRFIFVYFFRRGFLDGVAGFRYSVMLGIYEYMINLNLLELQHTELSEHSVLNPGAADSNG